MGVPWLGRGILAQSHVLTWKAFSRRTELTPGKDIVLACDSDRINQYVTLDSAVGFTGKIDAILGGLILSLILSTSTGTQDIHNDILSEFTRRLTDIIVERARPHLLDWYSDSQKITMQAMLTIAFTLTVCIASFDTVWQIVGFVPTAFTDYIVNVILAPLWASWLAFLQPIIWSAVFAALFTGVTILTGNPFCLSSLTAIKIAILSIVGLSTFRELIGTFVTNAVLVLIGSYNNLAGTVATVAWDLAALVIAMRTNAASYILASAYIVLLWDAAGLIMDLIW